jgi:hypothetical protein
VRNVRLGTVKKSKAAITSRWLLRKASQRFALPSSRPTFRLCRYRETVGSEISNPSWSNSPWMRGALYRGWNTNSGRETERFIIFNFIDLLLDEPLPSAAFHRLCALAVSLKSRIPSMFGFLANHRVGAQRAIRSMVGRPASRIDHGSHHR